MNDYKVTELAKAAGVTPDTVRHYTRLGLIRAAKDRQNGYRFFSGEALARLRFIKVAQGLGFTLKDIKLIFRDADKGDSPCPRVRGYRRADRGKRGPDPGITSLAAAYATGIDSVGPHAGWSA
jgi:DNA-binding transcriptional MerR regulator